MCSLLYEIFVIFIDPFCPLWLLAWWVVLIGIPLNFASLLLDWDLTQKLHNKLYYMHNNNNNILKFVWKIHQLFTRGMAQLVAGGLVTGELLYKDIQLALLLDVYDLCVWSNTNVLEVPVARTHYCWGTLGAYWDRHLGGSTNKVVRHPSPFLTLFCGAQNEYYHTSTIIEIILKFLSATKREVSKVWATLVASSRQILYSVTVIFARPIGH